jgi:hypothetical protein
MKVIILLSILFTSSIQAREFFTVRAEAGFAVSCADIDNYDGYVYLKQVFEQDMEDVRDAAILECEEQTGFECVEFKTRRELLDGDENTCFAISTARTAN